MTSELEPLGFDAFFAAQVEALGVADLVPARIAGDGQAEFWLLGSKARLATVAGRLIGGTSKTERPVVGDWVLVRDGERAVIHHLLARKTSLTRRSAGRNPRVQVIAANVDVMFIVTSANDDLNPRRLERYLSVVRESGSCPVVVINKVDCAVDPEVLRSSVLGVTADAPVVLTSATGDAGADALLPFIAAGKTAAFIGSSGVGKSSLVNRLLGREQQLTSALLPGDRGRHTTTRREIILLPEGGVLIDTPGMRELGLLDADDGVDATFPDVVALAEQCRFNDCKHAGDVGCAIQEAIAAGALDPVRFESFLRLQSEMAEAPRRAPRSSSKRPRR